MAAVGVEYVEIYTADEPATVDYFGSAFGFAPVAESVEPGRRSTLLRQGGAQLVVTAGQGVQEFLEAHGDGVADIALTCDDVAMTRKAAEAAGGRLTDSAHGTPAVSGFGGVSYTLLPSHATDAPAVPAARTWKKIPSAQPASTGRVLSLDHIATCVEYGSLADEVAFYEDAFGMPRYSGEYIVVGSQAMDSVVVRSPSGGVTFTLLEPDRTKSSGQIDAFLERNGGPGVQHLAFLVDEIVPAVREFEARGVEFLSTPGTYYDMLAERFAEMGTEVTELRAVNVLADLDEWGYLLQLFTRSPYERNTLFFELIQRRGSRGFGSANIKALYEAVERDRLALEQ
jgi:4-hydroxymandelate synthase